MEYSVREGTEGSQPSHELDCRAAPYVGLGRGGVARMGL